MATLTIPNSFTAGTPALANEVNANFTSIISWSSNIDQDNLADFTGELKFVIANGNAIVIQNNGNDESIMITQGALLGAGKASILITDNQTQTASGAAELKMVLAAGATIPAIHVTHGGVDSFKLTKDYLRLEALLKPPVKTTSERNAITSPEEGSVIYNSTTAQLNEKRNDSWAPVGSPVGSVQMFAGSVAPESWLVCNGSTLDSVANPKYAALFAVIGTTYGGTGANSFKVPDCRGIFVRGVGSQTIGAETYSATLGTLQNDATATNGLSTSSSGDHNHGTTSSATVPYRFRVSGVGPATFAVTQDNASVYTTQTIPGSDHSHTISTNGSHTHPMSSTDTETRPANIALNYIIKY